MLLDLGGAIQSPDALVDPRPGVGGTVSYLAPETEKEPYDTSRGRLGARHHRLSANPRPTSVGDDQEPLA